MKPLPTVTVAIPTLNAGALLQACLRALEAQTFRDFEVIIINNGNAPVLLPEKLPAFALRTLSPGWNTGFGAAVNLAIGASSSSYVATLNDDTEPEPNWLQALVDEMSRDAEIGMCASRIQMHASQAIDSAGMMICFDGSSRQRGHAQPASAFEQSRDVLFPSGCAALYRRTMLEEIGYFDEDYFLYCEDTDLGLRAQWAGWRCRYVATAVVAHHYSSTAGAFSAFKARFVERNRLWVALKTFPAAMLPAVPFFFASRLFWQFRAARGSQGAAAEFLRSGNSFGTAASIVVRAHWETLLLLPALMKKRVQLKAKRKVDSVKFMKLMRRHRISTKDLARA